MKKIPAFLCSLIILLSIVTTPFSVVALSSACTTQLTPEQCEETIEKAIAYGSFVIDDGVIYSVYPEGDNIANEGTPNPGTYEMIPILRALIYKYPEASFAVWLHSYASSKETKRVLNELGIYYVNPEYPFMYYAIMTAEQLENFPVSENAAYRMGLAPKMGITAPTLLGDANADESFDLVDVVCLQRYLIGQVEMDTTQLANSDITRDGKVNGFDLAAMKKMYLES